MATKKAKYKVAGDTYHFETDAQMVRVLNRDNSVRGTVRELLFEGKEVHGGSFKDIKQTGVYQVTGLRDLPAGFPSNRKCILSVTAIGDPQHPDVILYRAISPSGVISETTVSNGMASSWGSGGVKLQNELKAINADIAQMKGTEEDHHEDFLKHEIEQNHKLDELTQRFDKHNHDGRYVLKSGDMMTDTLNFGDGRAIGHVDAQGASTSAISFREGRVIFGDETAPVEFHGQSLKFNNERVITEGNLNLIKKYVGNVVASGNYISQNGDSVYGDLTFVDDAQILFKRSEGNEKVASIKADGYGTVSINGFEIDGGGQVQTIKFKNSLYLDASPHSDFISTPSFQADQLYVTNLVVNGKKVFLQQEQPSGDIPAGSVWLRY